MENLSRDIGIAIAAVFLSAWWWYTIKDVTSRKYILLFCVSFVFTMVAYVAGKSLDIQALVIIAGLLFLGVIYTGIKAILSIRRARKKKLLD